ncbi:hypothetical protein [Pseudarthrobacter sp. NPDC080039]|uniref:hypothetical protein n=1 Tax=unclassified Pseudarthrobacter TaxID=2647000 RepID=UPI0034507A27
MNSAPAPGATVPDESTAPARGGVLAEAVGILAAFAGLGAATLSFGTSSTLLTTAPGPWTIAGTVAACLWGAALTLWAVQSLRTGAPMWSRAVLRVAPAGAFLHLAGVAVGIWWPGGSPRSLNGTALSAAALELILLGCVGWLARQTSRPGRPANPQPAAGPLLMASLAAALTVAAITAPGLAATAAGQYAVPHGEHLSTNSTPPAGHHH